MMDPNAPAPKPRMIKQVEIPATRQLLNNVRILLWRISSCAAPLPAEKTEIYTGSSGTIQGEKNDSSPAVSTVPR